MLRPSLLLQTLLALGAIPPLPRRAQADIDREAIELMDDLQAAGIDPSAMLDAVGHERFVEMGRACLALAKVKRNLGEPCTDAAELVRLVDIEVARARKWARHVNFGRPVQMMTTQGAMAGKTSGNRAGKTTSSLAYIKEQMQSKAPKVVKVKPERDRHAQRSARKVRSSAKARRGW